MGMGFNELLDFLHKIEQAHNRERIVRWGPRTLDLDIILYDDVVMYEDDLIIPHIEMENREFVLKPLCEIAPYIKNPVNGKSIKQLLINNFVQNIFILFMQNNTICHLKNIVTYDIFVM